MKQHASLLCIGLLGLLALSSPYHAVYAGDEEMSDLDLEMEAMSFADGSDDEDELENLGTESEEIPDDSEDLTDTVEANVDMADEGVAEGEVAESAKDLEKVLEGMGLSRGDVMTAGWGKVLPSMATAAKLGLQRRNAAQKKRDEKITALKGHLSRVGKAMKGSSSLLKRYQERYKRFVEDGEAPESDAERRKIFFGGALLEDLAGKDAKIEARYQDCMRRIADMEANMAAAMWRTFDYTAEIIKALNARVVALENQSLGGGSGGDEGESVDAGEDEGESAMDESLEEEV